jgi:DHA2 family multidrug resistance protein-like MFS transporter
MSAVLSRESATQRKGGFRPPSIEAAGPVEDGLAPPRLYLAVGAILAATVLVVLDGAIANVALPSISRALRVSAADCVWVVTSYQLGVVIALLPCAALGESFGGRRVFLAGAALFAGASALCALSGNLAELAAARFIQGSAAARSWRSAR